MTDDEKYRFYFYQNAATGLTAPAISWSKVAFAITLSRIVRNRYLKYFLWFVMATANLNLIPATISIWVPACNDPRKVFRPAYPECLNHSYLEYLGGASIGTTQPTCPGPMKTGCGLTSTVAVYGGVIDVLLALFPFFIIRNLLLDTREKIALTLAMSMGAIVGTIVIFRAFYQLKQADNNFRTWPVKNRPALFYSMERANLQLEFMVFMSIFNFLEPSVTIIAQAIPMFRVLVVNVKKATSDVRISSSTQGLQSNLHSHQRRAWNSRILGGSRKEPDEALLQVRVDRTVQVSSTLASSGSRASVVMEDKLYDGTLRQH